MGSPIREGRSLLYLVRELNHTGLTHTSRRCRMVPEVDHAPATIETGLCCYDCSCGNCQQEQRVHVQVGTGTWSTAHQSIECLRCGQHFEVMLPDAIIGGP